MAGSHAELTLTYTAGKFGIDDTGMVKISWRTTSDMSKPQFDQPAAPNFTTVEASNGAKLDVWFDRLNIRPYANTLLIRVGRGYLRAGDTLTIRLGDRRQGSPGYRLQTNCEELVELKTSIDAFATYEFCELPEQPGFALVPGPAASWKAIWPSLAVVGEPFRLAIVAEDMWGNPTTEAGQNFTLVPSRPVRGLPESVATKPGDGPHIFENLVADEPGDIDLALVADGEEVARANPLRVVTASPLRRYWADLHGQSGETIGMGSAESYFRYARDKAFIDMVGHQGNDFQITDAFWARAQPAHGRVRCAGPLPLPARLRMVGKHWHGRRPQYFLSPARAALSAARRISWWKAKPPPMPSTPRTSCFARSKARMPWSSPMSAGAMRTSNMPMTDGSSAAWRCTRPGAPSNGSCTTRSRKATASASCATATTTRDALAQHVQARRLSALSAASPVISCLSSRAMLCSRHCASGGITARPACGFSSICMVRLLSPSPTFAEDPHFARGKELSVREALMGDIIRPGNVPMQLAAEVIGTAPIERIDVLHGTRVAQTVRPFAAADLGRRVRVLWQGAEYRGRGRETMWQGKLTLTGNRFLRFAPVNFLNPERNGARDHAGHRARLGLGDDRQPRWHRYLA